MKGRKIGLAVFLVGLFIVLYPFISQGYYEGQFRKQVNHFHEQTQSDEQSLMTYQRYRDYNHVQISRVEEIETADVNRVESADPVVTNNEIDYTESGILGSIAIPSINLLYPIYDGANDANLMKGVARVEGTSYPVGGMNTNSVIAGHTGMLNHVFFSNIDQLIIGDSIIIQNSMEMLTYEVYQTAVIYPHEVDALTVIPGQDTLTLLTCTYDLTQRLLVYARRIPNSNSNQMADNPVRSEPANKPIISVGIAIGATIQNYRTAILLFLLGIVVAYIVFILKKQ